MPLDVLKAVLRSKEGRAKDIADRYSVSVSAVAKSKQLKTARAKRVAKEMRAAGDRPVTWKPRFKRMNFSPAQVAEIRNSSTPAPATAEKYGCSESLIRMIRTGKVYKDGQ